MSRTETGDRPVERAVTVASAEAGWKSLAQTRTHSRELSCLSSEDGEVPWIRMQMSDCWAASQADGFAVERS